MNANKFRCTNIHTQKDKRWFFFPSSLAYLDFEAIWWCHSFSSLFAHDSQLLYTIFSFDIPKKKSQQVMFDRFFRCCCCYYCYCVISFHFVSLSMLFFSSHFIWVFFGRLLFLPFGVCCCCSAHWFSAFKLYFFFPKIYIFLLLSHHLHCVRSKSGGIIYTHTHARSQSHKIEEKI